MFIWLEPMTYRSYITPFNHLNQVVEGSENVLELLIMTILIATYIKKKALKSNHSNECVIIVKNTLMWKIYFW